MSTYLDLCVRVRQETGTQGTGPATTVSQTGAYKRIVDWVNQAYLEIQNKWIDWKFLWAEASINVVSGTATYSLAADCRLAAEDSFYYNSDTKLAYVPFDDYRRDRPAFDDMTAGTPEWFTILPNGQIKVFPTPAANLSAGITYEYYQTSESFSGNNDEPRFPEMYEDTIIWRAKMYWAEFENADYEYQTALQNFNLAMLRLEATQCSNSLVPGAHGRTEGTDFVVRAV